MEKEKKLKLFTATMPTDEAEFFETVIDNRRIMVSQFITNLMEDWLEANELTAFEQYAAHKKAKRYGLINLTPPPAKEPAKTIEPAKEKKASKTKKEPIHTQPDEPTN